MTTDAFVMTASASLSSHKKKVFYPRPGGEFRMCGIIYFGKGNRRRDLFIYTLSKNPSPVGWWTHPHFVRLVEYGSAIPPRGAGEVPYHYASNDCVHVAHHIDGDGVDLAWIGVQ